MKDTLNIESGKHWGVIDSKLNSKGNKLSLTLESKISTYEDGTSNSYTASINVYSNGTSDYQVGDNVSTESYTCTKSQTRDRLKEFGINHDDLKKHLNIEKNLFSSISSLLSKKQNTSNKKKNNNFLKN